MEEEKYLTMIIYLYVKVIVNIYAILMVELNVNAL